MALRTCCCCFISFLFSAGVFADDGPVSPAVFVNQSAYVAGHSKIGLVSSSIALPFTVWNLQTESPVLRSQLILREPNHAASGVHVWQADFSIVNATGVYAIDVPGLGRSHPFSISASPPKALAQRALNAFYFLREGAGFPKPIAGDWARKAQPSPAALVYPPTAEPKSFSLGGGWHDGSDAGRYVPSGVYAAGVLMTLHEWLPQVFEDGSLSVPEAHNGVPDILDEVRWEVEWLFSMQTSTGSVYHKATALAPDQPEKAPLYLFAPSTAASAGACAVWAKASRLYSPYDATFSAQCLNAAVRTWQWLELTPNDGGFSNPTDVKTKAYADADDSDERLWAAVELRRALNDERLDAVIAAMVEKRVPLLYASGYWGDVTPLAAAAIVSATEIETFEKLSDEVRSDLRSLADSLAEKTGEDAFLLTLDADGFTWGSNGAVLRNAMILLLAQLVEPEPRYGHAALEQMNYLLGRNPVGMSYVTGFGEASPQSPYQWQRYAGGGKTPIPGLIVAGPNQSLNDGVLKTNFSASSPPATAYKDDSASFSSNEFTIDWNAALVFVATVLSER
ncbi:MAG: glycoside hydrolase family 9 protein [Candidatus Hinthialibacter antarcticus]|nr:glycoside hydrolase family 9 protein [Candidatus Hinthialibacter antarcticus]